MRRVLVLCAALLAGVAAAADGAPAPRFAPDAALGLERPTYRNGPVGRLVLGGDWLFRLDSTPEWRTVAVPYAWNAGDDSVESFQGEVAWYRRDFRVPSADRTLTWIVRFNSTQLRAQVFLNGRRIARHTGAYLPWEVRLDGLRPGRVNRLEVRVDNRRTAKDFPPGPYGGWWNYGGLLREVELRPVRAVDLTDVTVRPELACATCSATVKFAGTVQDLAGGGAPVTVTARFGGRTLDFGEVTPPRGGSAKFAGELEVENPRLWSPDSPVLYSASVTASNEGGRAGWRTRTGIRSIEVGPAGELLLNGRALSLRGVGVHEDSPAAGAAIGSAERRRMLLDARELGANLLRSHYPLHPETYERADRLGMLVWAEVPVYQLSDSALRDPAVRTAAYDLALRNVEVNGDHPSIITWSVGNELELPDVITPPKRIFLRRAPALVRRADPTRPVSYAFAAGSAEPCSGDYSSFDLLGVNEYFGWYFGISSRLADSEDLGPYLDAWLECSPGQALMVSEFGVEANRTGPVEEKGTYAFQAAWTRQHLDTFASRPWLAGWSYWALQEFRVVPGWAGGNPRPSPPIHTKGLISFDGTSRKPAYDIVRDAYGAVPLFKTPDRLGRRR